MTTMHQWRAGLFVLLGVLVMGVVPGWAANCGDTAGPGGTRVACACGDTVVTDTVLKSTDPVVSTGPGDVCAGGGLSFGAPDLTLDCKGLMLRGPGIGAGIGISEASQPGTTIQGCGVVAFNLGIRGGGAETTVVNSKAVGNDYGIFLDGVSQRAERNQGESNDYGMYVSGSASVVTQNRLIGNGVGIWVRNSGNLVSANITDGNSQFGLLATEGPNVLEGNRGKDNGSHGIAVFEVWGPNTLRRNVYDTNGGHGICAAPGNIDGGANRGAGNALQPDVDFTCT